jgi:iron complex outermembrane receptor protein
VSVEARLASNGDGPLQWVAGVYWLDDHQHGVSDVGTSLAFLSRRAFDKLDLTSSAAFAQASFALTPGFRLVGGARYTSDDKSMDGNLYNVSRTNGAPLTTPIHVFGDKTFTNTSYKAGVEYDVAPEHMVYANISTGYKAGGFNAGTPPNTYEPEKIKAYTAGSKNTFMDRRIVLNVEGWYWDYENVNQFQFGLANAPVGVANVQLLTYNAAKLISKGVELQSQFAVGENGRFTLNAAYTDSTFDDFKFPAFVFGPFNIAASDFSGRQNTSAPRWSGNIGYQQRFPFAKGDAVIADVSTQIQSSEFITVAAVPGVQRDGRSVSDASLTYQAPAQRWQIQAWVKNIEDEPVWAWGGNGPAGLWADPGAPRTYGVTARANF